MMVIHDTEPSVEQAFFDLLRHPPRRTQCEPQTHVVAIERSPILLQLSGERGPNSSTSCSTLRKKKGVFAKSFRACEMTDEDLQ